MSDLHVVLGGTGGAGRAITAALAAQGIRVRAVSRSTPSALPPGATHAVADLTDPVSAKEAVRDASVVHMAAQPDYTRWPQEFPALLEAVIAATASAGAKLVVVDNCYAYGPVTGPMAEGTPQRATDPKGRVRAAMADRVLAAHAAGEVRATIGRASDFFGPGIRNSGIQSLALEPLRRPGARLRWVGRDDVAHSAAFMPDIARAFAALGTDDRADGRIWHLPHAPAVTGAAFLDLVNACLPAPRRTGLISPLALRIAAPFAAIPRETLSIVHQWAQPFVVDDTAFRETFGLGATPLAEAVEVTVASILQGGAA